MAQHISLFLALGLEAAALIAAGDRCAPAVPSRIYLYPTWLPPHGKDPGVPTVSLLSPEWMSQMPPAVNMDIKVLFETYDMTPGATGKRFVRNLLIHGGKADARGFTYADCFLRIDEGAVVGPGGAAPGAVPMPGAAAQLLAATQARRARIKGSFEYLTRHLTDEHTLELLGDPANTMFQDGPELFDYIQSQVIVQPITSELQDMNIDWYQIEIITDIGSSENTIKDALKLLRYKNAERPVARRFTDDEVAEKLLMMIKNGSKTFSESANVELNAIEGVPGQPGVRLFQLVVPALPPLVRPRDLLGMVNHFHNLWRDAVKGGRLPKANPTGRQPRSTARLAVENALPADAAQMGREIARSVFANQTGNRATSPTASLEQIHEAGFSISRGTVTTSDFNMTGSELIASAVTEDGIGDGFNIEMAFDADETPSVELICTNCRGLGHPRSLCPSPAKFRSFSYAKSHIENALERNG